MATNDTVKQGLHDFYSQNESLGGNGSRGDAGHVNVKIAVVFMLSVFSVVGVIGNAIAFYIFFGRRSMSTSVFFILTLAGTDFITCLVTIPYTIAFEILNYHLVYDLACKTYMFLITSTVPFSAYIMVVIALDRYFCICHPFLYFFTVPRAKAVVFCMGIPAVIFGLITALSHGTNVYRTDIQSNSSNNVVERLAVLSKIEKADLDRIIGAKNLTNVNVRVSIVPYGECVNNTFIFSQEFLEVYEKIHALNFLLAYLSVAVLYTLIYKSIFTRRVNKAKRRKSNLYPTSSGKTKGNHREETQMTAIIGGNVNSPKTLNNQTKKDGKCARKITLTARNDPSVFRKTDAPLKLCTRSGISEGQNDDRTHILERNQDHCRGGANGYASPDFVNRKSSAAELESSSRRENHDKGDDSSVYISPHTDKGDNCVYIGPQTSKEDNCAYFGPQTSKEDNCVYIGPQTSKEDNCVYIGPQTSKEVKRVHIDLQTGKCDNCVYIDPLTEKCDNCVYIGPQTSKEVKRVYIDPLTGKCDNCVYIGPQTDKHDHCVHNGPQTIKENKIVHRAPQTSKESTNICNCPHACQDKSGVYVGPQSNKNNKHVYTGPQTKKEVLNVRKGPDESGVYIGPQSCQENKSVYIGPQSCQENESVYTGPHACEGESDVYIGPEVNKENSVHIGPNECLNLCVKLDCNDKYNKDKVKSIKGSDYGVNKTNKEHGLLDNIDTVCQDNSNDRDRNDDNNTSVCCSDGAVPEEKPLLPRHPHFLKASQDNANHNSCSRAFSITAETSLAADDTEQHRTAEKTAVNSQTNSINKKRSTTLRDRHLMANIKIALMLFIVTLVFFIAFLPALLMANDLIPLNLIIFYSYFIYNVVNPFIYAFMNQTFREDLTKLMKVCQG